MIPIRDANPTRRRAWITLALIATNVALFLLWQPTFSSERKQQTFFFCHAEIPYEVAHTTNLAQGGPAAALAIAHDYGPGTGTALQSFLQRRCPGKSWALSVLAAMFLHGGWLHIGGNMLFLWVFGNNVEDRLGRPLFLIFYLAGGVAASALQIALDPSSTIPTLGASGAIAAVLGAYLVMFPRARIQTVLILFVFISVVELPAVVVLTVWFVFQLFSGLGSLGTHVNQGGIAYTAHVGGFAFGLVVAWLFFRNRGERRRAFEVPPRPDPS
jgi:membrane associated rhomboid family serine protease